MTILDDSARGLCSMTILRWAALDDSNCWTGQPDAGYDYRVRLCRMSLPGMCRMLVCRVTMLEDSARWAI